MTHFFLGNWSYLGIVAILVLTGAGLPLPEEVPVIAAGVLSSHGQMEPWLAFLACVVGALAGDTVMYWLGRHFGRSILREQSWWAKIIHPEREAKIEEVIKNHGLKVLFSARFLVGIRAPVYVAAGILHLPYRRFILMDLLCATTVVGMFFWTSYWFGEAITKWIKDAEIVVTVLVVVAVLGLILYFWRRHRRKVREKLEEELLAALAGEEGGSTPEVSTEKDASAEGESNEASNESEEKNASPGIPIPNSPEVRNISPSSPTTYAAQDRH